jgi:raffinose/stachyose/melibiose transport system permease protein
MANIHSRHAGDSKKVVPIILKYLFLIILTIIILTPIVILIFGSLKTRGEMYSRPYTIPNPPRIENYVKIVTESTFWRLLLNSVVVMLGATVGVLLVCSLAAFVFSHFKFRGKSFAYNFLTLGLMFPITVAIMPVYLVIRQLDLTDSLVAVILVQTAFNISGNIIILRNFFNAIPRELEDAAYIDGCTSFDYFWRILLPLARPGLSAVAALTMIVSWNDLLTPLIMLNDDKKWTLPLGTMQFQGQYGQDLALIAAFVTMAALPTIIFYLIAEKQIVSGLTAGAIKG